MQATVTLTIISVAVARGGVCILTPTTLALLRVGGTPARNSVPSCPLPWLTLPWATGGWEDAHLHVPQRPVESLGCWVSPSQISLSSSWGQERAGGEGCHLH